MNLTGKTNDDQSKQMIGHQSSGARVNVGELPGQLQNQLPGQRL